jgi:acetyltransferase-like isoleucine patch superfamily enzyme
MLKAIKRLILSSSLLQWFFFRTHNNYLFLFKKQKKIGQNVSIGISSILEGSNAFGNHSLFINSKIGFSSYISEHSKFQNTKIGKFCSIGPNVEIIRGNHPTKQFVTTHPAFFSLRKHVGYSFVETQLFEEYPKPIVENEIYTTSIGNDVWIGANVKIIEGVVIGDGAIVAAGSVVTKNLPAYGIYGGIPAKFIRNRFEAEEIEFLKNFEWWNKPFDWLQKNSMKFVSIEEFKKAFQ